MDQELERKRKELERRIADDRRRRSLIVATFAALAIIIAAGAYLTSGDLRNAVLLIGVVAAGILIFAGSRLFPGVSCPGCERTFDDDFGPYCPECGTHGLKIVDKHYKADCQNCRKKLAFTGRTGNGRRRLHKIRFCTNCGLSFGQRPL